jgi:hypothetical protein
MDDHDRTYELRELATFARNKRDLYRARTYSPRETSATRLRELERASEQAEARLKAYILERSKLVAAAAERKRGVTAERDARRAAAKLERS